MVFGTLWFNGLLVLLVINTACCFFGRMWRRRVTIVSFGMILFHLSFVAMFAAIVFNSLFYFDGALRLTEGETLLNRDPKSYDNARHGLFFAYSRLKGETILSRVHRGYKVDGEEKNIAYDVAVAEGGATSKEGTIYINNKFGYKGVEYVRDREGYSLLVIVNDRQGDELYGAHTPLQSYKQKDDSYLYATGTMAGPGLINFPPEKDATLFGLQLAYYPDNSKDRSGRVRFQIWPAKKADEGHAGHFSADGAGHIAGSEGHTGSPMTNGATHSAGEGNHFANQLADGTVKIGEKFAFGRYELLAPEVRYWVGMNVRYNPGKPFVLASLCMGLAGMVITTIGRMLRGRK
jgi:hypothetical protein